MRIYIIAVIILVSLGSFAAAPKKMAPRYKVVFYNVENLFDTIDGPNNDAEMLPNGTYKYTGQVYKTHLDRISNVLANICETDAPLFIGLAEIENRLVVQDLISQPRLKPYNLGIVHNDSPDERGIDVGLIYNKDVAKIIKEEYLYVNIDSVPEFKTRMIFHATFETTNGTILHVYVNHWPSRRDGEAASAYRREQAALALKKSTREVLLNDENANVIVMGDFNDYPKSPSITKTLGANSYKEVVSDYTTLYNISEANPADTVVKGSHCYKGEWGSLDQIMLSRNMLKYNGAVGALSIPYHIFYKKEMLYMDKSGAYVPDRFYVGTKLVGGYSDHLPVYFDMGL